MKKQIIIAATTGILLLLVVIWQSGLNHAQNTNASIQETVVVAEPADPYYALAQKIAGMEKLELVHTWDKARDLNPRFIILVASPENLTNERFLKIGRDFAKADYYPGLGIITASTLDKAEQLWHRQILVRSGNNYVGGDVETTQRVYAPTIFDISEGAAEEIELDKANLLRVLGQADYIYWTRHTGGATWFWNSESPDWGEDDELFSKDIPSLKPAVIYAPTCNNLRPWVKNSIALGFVDQGAAVYVGHTNSPHTNAFFKHGLAVPGLSSWKEFPIGLVVQVTSRAGVRTIFNAPQLFMLGDPRTYLAPEPPYRIISDTTSPDGRRVLEGESAVDGVVSFKVDQGARYDYVEITGVTSAGDDDVFLNTRLQTMDLAGDKYLLFLHNGGHFRITLAASAPLGWGFVDALTDALDFSWVVLWLNVEIDNAPLIYALALPMFGAVLLFKVLVRKRSLNSYARIFLIAALLAVLRVVYFILRMDDYSVSANYVNATNAQVALGAAGVFACIAGGLMLVRDARRIPVRLLGIVFAVLPQFLLAGFYLLFLTFYNLVTPVTGMTTQWVFNYSVFWLAFIVLLVEIALVLGAYRVAQMTSRQMVAPAYRPVPN